MSNEQDSQRRPTPIQLKLLEAMRHNRVGYTPQEAAILLWPNKIHKWPRGNGLAMAAGSLLGRLAKHGYIAKDESYDTMKVYTITDHGLSLLATIHAENEAIKQAAMHKANSIIHGIATNVTEGIVGIMKGQPCQPMPALFGLRDAIKWAIIMKLTDPKDQEAQALRIMATYRPSDWKGKPEEEQLYQDILGAISSG